MVDGCAGAALRSAPPTQRSACRCGDGIAKPVWRPVSLHLHRHEEVVRTARNTARLVLAGVGGHPASMGWQQRRRSWWCEPWSGIACFARHRVPPETGFAVQLTRRRERCLLPERNGQRLCIGWSTLVWPRPFCARTWRARWRCWLVPALVSSPGPRLVGLADSLAVVRVRRRRLETKSGTGSRFFSSCKRGSSVTLSD